eukprot:748913-Hanusia_phi.AAC.1
MHSVLPPNGPAFNAHDHPRVVSASGNRTWIRGYQLGRSAGGGSDQQQEEEEDEEEKEEDEEEEEDYPWKVRLCAQVVEHCKRSDEPKLSALVSGQRNGFAGWSL